MLSLHQSSIPELIAKKRDGHEYNRQELTTLIEGYTAGDIPDYQMSAWLMAVFLRGMTLEETCHLTELMAQSGDQIDLAGLNNTVDKHSTGGVGDKTSLVLAPMLAALGQTVAKMSGRGLAHTGGTIDKLESFAGWSGELSEERFYQQARELGLVLVGQSKNLAPVDGLLYALRDVTATVPSLPLIASSIMSKKIAAGAGTIVLDVKVGSGAFMKTLEGARALATLMIHIGQRAGRQTRVLLTNMDAPLGHMIGNALEVQEALFTLQGDGPDDLTALCVALASEVLQAHGETPERAKQRAQQVLQDGSALEKFRRFVTAQGGRLDSLQVSSEQQEVRATRSGHVRAIEAMEMGRAALLLGGGRTHKGEQIDHGVGLELMVKVGDRVQDGQVLAKIYHRAERGLMAALELVQKGIIIKDTAKYTQGDSPEDTQVTNQELIIQRLS